MNSVETTLYDSLLTNGNLNTIESFLLSKIYFLDKGNGCTETNYYFSKLVNRSIDRISKIISSLKKKGYVNVDLIYVKNKKQIDKRIITCTDKFYKIAGINIK